MFAFPIMLEKFWFSSTTTATWVKFPPEVEPGFPEPPPQELRSKSNTTAAADLHIIIFIYFFLLGEMEELGTVLPNRPKAKRRQGGRIQRDTASVAIGRNRARVALCEVSGWSF
jgi:hypothetical protein